jgi:hypothetical protein
MKICYPPIINSIEYPNIMMNIPQQKGYTINRSGRNLLLGTDSSSLSLIKRGSQKIEWLSIKYHTL